jgi:hypothetical protein
MQPTLSNGYKTSTTSPAQHLKVANDRMKARYDQLANSTGFQEGDRVWLYRPNR